MAHQAAHGKRLDEFIQAMNADLTESTVCETMKFLLIVWGAHGPEYMTDLVEGYCQRHKDLYGDTPLAADVAMSRMLEELGLGKDRPIKSRSRYVTLMAETLMKIRLIDPDICLEFKLYACLFLNEIIPQLEFLERYVGSQRMLALSVCVTDGYLVPIDESRRFWTIVVRLPYDLQAVLAARVCSSAATVVPWSEAALSWALL